MRALYTAATGMAAQELNVQVISNNIANMRTTGYKKQRAAFQDLIYDHVRRVGDQASDQGTILPVGVDIGRRQRAAAGGQPFADQDDRPGLRRQLAQIVEGGRLLARRGGHDLRVELGGAA